MARPSKKEQRSEEILDAYERCVVSFGVEGATLQRVADEAGLARPLLHHYVGNREDLLDALIARWVARAESEDAAFEAYLPESGRCRAYIESLFDPAYASSSHEILLYQALLVAAQQRPALRARLSGWYEEFVDDFIAELKDEYETTDKAALREVATAVVALYFNADSMASMTDAESLFRDSKRAALRILETL